MAVCRICEQSFSKADLPKHLVLCTANHSCRDRLRRTDAALKQFVSRVQQRKSRIAETMRKIEVVYSTPFALICKHIDEAAGVMAPDPIQLVYRLIVIQGKLRAKFAGLSDASFAELVSQADSLVSQKIEVYWDLLSLQDPADAKSGTNTTLLSDSMPKGTSIRDFTLKRLVGRGGFGNVWLAERKRTRDLVAIKVLSRKETTVRMMNRAVHLEKNILAHADSPYVIKLFFSFSTANHLYMAMEYAPCSDCFSLLSSLGFLEEAIARFFLGEAVCGLQYLHSSGIIHRDLKPQNMLIMRDGHIKLTDFGLSAVDDPPASPKEAGKEPQGASGSSLPSNKHNSLEVGTADYLAPEILRRQWHDQRVDFWALGVVAYHLLAGETPFGDSTATKIYAKVLVGEYERLSPSDVSPEAVDLLSQLIVLDPDERLGHEQGCAALPLPPPRAPFGWHHHFA